MQFGVVGSREHGTFQNEPSPTPRGESLNFRKLKLSSSFSGPSFSSASVIPTPYQNPNYSLPDLTIVRVLIATDYSHNRKVGLERMTSTRAVSHTGAIVIIVVILAIAAVGVYFGYSLSGHPATQTNELTLQGFSLNPATSNLTGTVSVESNSPLARMTLYMNGTDMGSFDYGTGHSGMMMSTTSGSYPYMGSMMYSAYPATMPMMANFPMMQGPDLHGDHDGDIRRR